MNIRIFCCFFKYYFEIEIIFVFVIVVFAAALSVALNSGSKWWTEPKYFDTIF